MSPQRCSGGALLAPLRRRCSRSRENTGIAVRPRTTLPRAGLGRWVRDPRRLPPVRGSTFAEWSAAHALFGLCAIDPHPYARRETGTLPRLGSGRRAALVTVGLPCPFRSTTSTATRCFVPTSATDFESLHPQNVRFPSVGLSPPPTDPAGRGLRLRSHQPRGRRRASLRKPGPRSMRV